ncbi:MAG: molybdenum cofactor biosynthesis protein MoaE [Verrucomicrobiae bacterium]|nr:molybdenum cofactor biosynthesis protein MoaE [Verrucomicrobiae bacterium]
MKKKILFTFETISPLPFPQKTNSIGSIVEFHGVVRDEESQQTITHLDYEAYQDMAHHQIHKILDQLKLDYPCRSFEFVHRLGKIPVGESSVWIRITSKHRKEGFGLLTEFCNRLKQDVPIWKSAPNL